MKKHLSWSENSLGAYENYLTWATSFHSVTFSRKKPLFWHVYPFNLLYKGEQAPCSRPFIWLLNLNDYKGLMILLDLIHGITIIKIAFLCCLVGFFYKSLLQLLKIKKTFQDQWILEAYFVW